MSNEERQDTAVSANDKLNIAAYTIEGAALGMHKVANGKPITYAQAHKMIINAINNLLFIAQEITNAADSVEDMFS